MTGWSRNEPPGSASNPLPYGITNLMPPTARIGDPEVTLRVRGWGFRPGMEIVVNEKPRLTTFVSTEELTTKVTPPASGEAGRYTIKVKAFVFISESKDFNLLKPKMELNPYDEPRS
jgi:hypothetical protein